MIFAVFSFLEIFFAKIILEITWKSFKTLIFKVFAIILVKNTKNINFADKKSISDNFYAIARALAVAMLKKWKKIIY